jgi:hypothetical protein
MIKIDKSIITFNNRKCILDKTDANIKIQKLGNVFFKVQQMFTQLGVYLIILIPLYHSS